MRGVALLVLLTGCGACGTEPRALPAGVYLMAGEVVDSNVVESPVGKTFEHSFWSIAKVRGDWWIRNWNLPQGLAESRDGDKYIYESGWAENNGLTLYASPTSDGDPGFCGRIESWADREDVNLYVTWAVCAVKICDNAEPGKGSSAECGFW